MIPANDGEPLELLAARLLRDGVPSSLIIDLFDPVGMQKALASELAEAQAATVLAEVAATRPADWSATG